MFEMDGSAERRIAGVDLALMLNLADLLGAAIEREQVEEAFQISQACTEADEARGLATGAMVASPATFLAWLGNRMHRPDATDPSRARLHRRRSQHA